MMQGEITELDFYGVFEPGVPNRERVVLRVLEHVDMASFALVIGQVGDDGSSVPIPDHFFWFGNAHLKPGDWIYVYSGGGAALASDVGPNKLFSLYWGKKQTLFHAEWLRPVLIRMDAIKNRPMIAGQVAGPQTGIQSTKSIFRNVA